MSLYRTDVETFKITLSEILFQITCYIILRNVIKNNNFVFGIIK